MIDAIGYEHLELDQMIRANLFLALIFWSAIRFDWLFWPACLVVGITAAVLITRGRRRAKEVWARLRTRERIIVRCLVIAALWCVLALLEHDRIEASWMTATTALFWGAYALFSRIVDGVWSRVRRH